MIHVISNQEEIIIFNDYTHEHKIRLIIYLLSLVDESKFLRNDHHASNNVIRRDL